MRTFLLFLKTSSGAINKVKVEAPNENTAAFLAGQSLRSTKITDVVMWPLDRDDIRDGWTTIEDLTEMAQGYFDIRVTSVID